MATQSARIRQLASTSLLILLTSCSQEYKDLKSAYATDMPLTGTKLETRTISISSRNYVGVMTYRDIVDVRVNPQSINFKVKLPFFETIKVPANDIAVCAMTCFGMNDRYVNLLIPKTSSELSLKGWKEMVQWCWDNSIPMASGKEKRDWLYDKKSLPSRKSYEEQLSSREVYDKQVERSCMGY